MTISEANAVNRLLDWVMGRQPYPYHVPLPTDQDAQEACEYLADRANKALYAGWSSDRIRVVWPERRLR